MSNNWIQKRKYTKGYFVANKAKKKSDKVQHAVKANETVQLAHDPIIAEITPLPLTPLKTFNSVNSNHSTPSESNEANTKEARKALENQWHNSAFIGDETVNLASEATVFKPLDKAKRMDDTEFILIVILCVVLPPLAVFLMYDISTEFWISLLLTLLFWVPGVIYALILAFDIY